MAGNIHEQEQSRKLTGEEIVGIITETLDESAKDIMNLEERRPLVHFAVSLAFDFISTLGKDGIDFDSSVPFEGDSRNLKRAYILNQCIKKLEECREIDAT